MKTCCISHIEITSPCNWNNSLIYYLVCLISLICLDKGFFLYLFFTCPDLVVYYPTNTFAGADNTCCVLII